ncbi:hypothetical protein FALCPG4_015793 [Fusarium falciforme]
MPLQRLPWRAPESVPESRDTSLPHGQEIRPQNDDDHSSRTHLAPRTSRDSRKTCGVCGKSFRWSHSRTRHERLHRPQELKFVCEGRCGKTGCERAYTRRDELGRHLASFSNVSLRLPPYWPEETSGGQPSRGHETQQSSRSNHLDAPPPDADQDGISLMRYEEGHTGKGHKCPHCPQRLPTRYRLVIHLRSHTDEREFACAICGHAYKHPQSLQKHAKRCLPPAQLPHQQNMTQNTPVASDIGISESFPVCQGEDLASTVGTPKDNLDTGYPPMATEGFLIQHPPVLMAPTDGTDQGFYGDNLPIQTWPAGAVFCTNPWDEILLAPPIIVTTQQGMPGGKPENQEEEHLETVCFNTSWVHIK